MTQNKDKPNQQEIDKAAFVHFLNKKVDELFNTSFYGKFIVEFRAGKIETIRMSDVIITKRELRNDYQKDKDDGISITRIPPA